MPDLGRMEEALHRIVQWAEAYPLDIFPEPDWKAARAPLQAAGKALYEDGNIVS